LMYGAMLTTDTVTRQPASADSGQSPEISLTRVAIRTSGSRNSSVCRTARVARPAVALKQR
jgi:hypothetical protein